MTTNDSRCTHEIKSRIFMAKVAFIKKRFFTSENWIEFKKKLMKC